MKSLELTLTAFATGILLAIQASAATADLGFHLGCDHVSIGCIELPLASELGRKVFVKRSAEFTVGPDDFDRAELITGPLQSEQVSLKLKAAPAEKLAKLTETNLEKQLVLVSGDTALFAASIQSKIQGGSFVIGGGAANGHAIFDRIPWLKAMSDQTKVIEHQIRNIWMTVYLVIGAIVILGSISYAFLGWPKSRRAQRIL